VTPSIAGVPIEVGDTLEWEGKRRKVLFVGADGVGLEEADYVSWAEFIEKQNRCTAASVTA
jgi:hypothetical protein